MAIPNWISPATQGATWAEPAAGLRPKLPQAKAAVANSTSHGTSCSKKLLGVSSNSTEPTAPPIKLIATRARNDSRPAPLTSRRAIQPPVSWPGKSATVEVMFAARASMPVRISAGRVMNEPPPANWFCAGPEGGTEEQAKAQGGGRFHVHLTERPGDCPDATTSTFNSHPWTR